MLTLPREGVVRVCGLLRAAVGDLDSEVGLGFF